MVSIRKRRLRMQASTRQGNDARLRQLEPRRVPSTHHPAVNVTTDQPTSSSVLARAMPAKEGLRPDHDHEHNISMALLPSTDFQVQLVTHSTRALPAETNHREGVQISNEEEHTDDEFVVSESEQRDASTPEILLSGESSEGSLEKRYLRSWRETSSASSRRQIKVEVSAPGAGSSSSGH